MTNDCDLDCFYCHKEGCLDGDREMSPQEIGHIVRGGSEFGIEKVKLTGREPLVRDDMEEVVTEVATLSIVDAP